MIITATPLRVSLVGGGTDLPAFCNHYTGAVVSFTIDKYVYIMVNKKFGGGIRVSYMRTENVANVASVEHEIVREALLKCQISEGIEIVSVADVPGTGTGLGSSSAFAVGLLNALNQYMIKYGVNLYFLDLAAEACEIEIKKCAKPIGRQDQYAAAYGGLNYMEFEKDKVRVERIDTDKEYLDMLQNHMMLLYMGARPGSSKILEEQQEQAKDEATLHKYIAMTTLARDMKNALEQKAKAKRIGELLDINWRFKKELAGGISNADIDNAYSLAKGKGAFGAKVCGAGGSGFMLVVAPPEKHEEIETVLSPFVKMPFRIDMQGTRLFEME